MRQPCYVDWQVIIANSSMVIRAVRNGCWMHFPVSFVTNSDRIIDTDVESVDMLREIQPRIKICIYNRSQDLVCIKITLYLTKIVFELSTTIAIVRVSLQSTGWQLGFNSRKVCRWFWTDGSWWCGFCSTRFRSRQTQNWRWGCDGAPNILFAFIDKNDIHHT